MKRFVPLSGIAACLSLALVISACGGGDDGATATGSATATGTGAKATGSATATGTGAPATGSASSTGTGTASKTVPVTFTTSGTATTTKVVTVTTTSGTTATVTATAIVTSSSTGSVSATTSGTGTGTAASTGTRTATPTSTASSSGTGINTAVSTGAKPRIIATTDGEVDDKSSMVRFLMYTSDFELVGISQNNSIFQKTGHSREKWIEAKIDLYAEALPNLKVHHPDFPDAAYLKSKVVLGNENPADLQAAPQNMATKDTPGSQLIMDTLLDGDPRDVHVPSWGGANTTAYALWKIKTTLPADQFDLAVKKIWLYGICYNLTNKAQDGGYKWIIDNMPDVRVYQAVTWAGTWNYDSVDGMRLPSKNPKDVQAYMDPAWLTKNVKSGHGSLGASYPQNYVSEGDTPGFLSLINNGLDSHVDYTLGGWAGRAKYQTAGKGYMVDAPDANGTFHAIYRFIPAAENDFAARMDWAVTPTFAGANHAPKAKVTGGTRKTVSAGETVSLDAAETTDPDSDSLKFKWWQYQEADSASPVSISNDTAQTGASFTVPNESGKQVQIILEVTDTGTPPLTHYQRLIFNIQ